jgi:peptide/nickel transport system substrate-binding protein
VSSTTASSATTSDTSSASPSDTASTGGSTSGDPHGGVTLSDPAPLATTQGTQKLVVENNPHASLQQNFNQFNGNGFGYQLNMEAFFYEPLLVFNALKAQAAYKWLATDFAWNADGTSINFTIRDNVKFSDGTTLTGDDVAYTFQVMKDHIEMNRSGLPIDSATASGNTVTVKFTKPQFQNLYNIAGQTFIVEKKAYSSQSDPVKFADPTPVGTGPYTLGSFSPSGIVLKANPNYWGGKPPVPEVDIPAYSTNDVALQQLAAGKIDYAGNFISHIDQSFVAKDPAHNKYWFPAINTVNLVYNVSKPGLGDPLVRRAIAAGINRTSLSQQAEQGYQAPASSSSGLLLPNFEANVPAAYKNDIKPTPDQATVDTLMKQAGYAKGADGKWAKGGQKVTFKIEDPSAFTDYFDAAKIMAQDLQTAGFDASASGVDTAKWFADLAAGNFDTAIHWGTTSPSPYAQYAGWVDSSLVGSNRTGNYGGFKSPEADQALADYAKAATNAQAQTAIDALSKVVSEQAPITPLLYAAGWYEYNTKNYSGWVDKDNQYVDPSPNPANCMYLILHLKPNA